MNACWTIRLNDIETKVRVGIHPQEREPQRVLVGVEVEAKYPLQPENIEQCLNYEMIYDRVTKLWPSRPHTDLLETLVIDLLVYLFAQSPLVQKASVGVAKPDIFVQAERVSVSLSWSRADYETEKGRGVI